MIDAHGTTLTVDNDAVRINYSGLAAALRGHDVDGDDITSGSRRDIAISEITDVQVHAPTAFDLGWVRLLGPDVTVYFSPNQEVQAQRFADHVTAARTGAAPAEAGVVGLNAVAMSIATANPDWGSVCRIELTRLIDGVAEERRTYLVQPPVGVDEFEPDTVSWYGVTAADVEGRPRVGEVLPEVLDFIGDLPLVAHNAYFQASALRRAALASGVELPEISFGCTLALVRAAQPELPDHGLAAVAKHYGVEGELDDAGRTAGILVALAERGPLMEQFHAAGFTLGQVSSDPVIPVLLDRSGAGRALQAAGETSAGEGGAGTDFRDAATAEPPVVTEEQVAEESGQSSRRRGPAPWQSVATPDEIPEPNAAADPDNPLFGQHVTLTGDFEPFDKGQIWAGIAERGGEVGKNVTKKTTILVVGTWATKTSKEKKAEEYQAKGQEIQIWPGEKLLGLLELDEEPPF
ncbi:exonuclease domain-containing protein [Corynebacterium guangdongense]|uniref:DNA polymerase-3 subunit epsilon n=1 Tax=Corynebacterium guangdongense TaxID=1783348 RepID=A0ABU1ZXP7_9CORY|nr:exonuclease domain-containing protein [Corynebacterium guangdongense]MDR7329700.1 DNA polymerase-3 subunit epsilon [Corynebacterium guangdongense]WJZ18264.1 DNA polymerase III subunit epsilon [Corynebacterium guangdongense]